MGEVRIEVKRVVPSSPRIRMYWQSQKLHTNFLKISECLYIIFHPSCGMYNYCNPKKGLNRVKYFMEKFFKELEKTRLLSSYINFQTQKIVKPIIES